MDLPHFFRVIWRFKFLVAGGLLLAFALAVLAVFKVSPTGPNKLQYRQAQQWADDATLLVAPPGFPWGGTVIPPSADPAKFASLATIYAHLISSAEVKRLVVRGGPVDFAAEPIISTVVPYSYQSSNSPPLPLITLEAQAATKARAVELVNRVTKAFLDYLRIQQTRAGLPIDKRVVVRVVDKDQIRLLKGRSKTMPIMIFLLVAIASVGLAFLFENLRPRTKPVTSDEVALGVAGEVRRTA